jgi:hypothetical protein
MLTIYRIIGELKHISTGSKCQTDVISFPALARALMPMRIRTGARAGARIGIGKNMSSRGYFSLPVVPVCKIDIERNVTVI